MSKFISENEGKIVAFLEDTLSAGKTLSRMMLKQLKNHRWEISIVPSEAYGVAYKSNLNEGGMSQRKVGICLLADILRPRLEMLDEFLIFEHALATKGAPFLETSESRRFYFKDEVYLWTENEPDLNIIGAINSGTTASSFRAFATLGPRPKLFEEDTTRKVLKSISREVTMIIVGIFDNEGFLIFSRPEV